MRFALGFGRVDLGQAEMLSQALDVGELVTGRGTRTAVARLLHEVKIKHAVDDEVGVTPDRRGEMRVVFFCQAVVAVRLGAINGLLEAAQKLGAKRVALRVRAQDAEKFYRLGATCEVADDDAEGGGELAKLLGSFSSSGSSWTR